MRIAKTVFLAGLLTLGLACGYSKPANTPAQAGTVPAITILNPTGQAAGGGAFSFEVDGSGFASNAVINFHGVAETTTFMSAGKLTAMIPAAAITNSGTVPVTVTNPGTAGGLYGGGTLPETSNSMSFTIN
jgi:hypothetical protein